MTVRPEILRSYYLAAWSGASVGRFRGATFDEMVELLRIEYPTITPEIAAQRAPAMGRPDLRSARATASFEDVRPDLEAPDLEALGRRHAHVFVQKSGPVDLIDAIGRRRPRIVTCHRNDVSGWAALRRGNPWIHLHFYLSKTKERQVVRPRVACEVLVVSDCDDNVLEVLTSSVETAEAQLTHARPVNLALLADHERLHTLYVAAPRIHGVRHLRTRRLRVLIAPTVWSLEEVAPALHANATTLEVLNIQPERPFSPRQLPALPRLRRLEVTAFDDLQSEWIAFAVEEAAFGIRFVPRGAHAASAVRYEPLGSAGAFDTLKVTKSGEEHFEVRSVLPCDIDRDGVVAALNARSRGARERSKIGRGVVTLTASCPSAEAAERVAQDLVSLSTRPRTTPSAKPPRRRSAGEPVERRRRKAEEAGSAQPFEHWEGHVDPKRIRAARAIIADASRELEALGRSATADQQKRVLRRAVESFNELDAREGHFIQTIEAEDISDAIDSLAKRTKLKRRTQVADEWRDW